MKKTIIAVAILTLVAGGFLLLTQSKNKSNEAPKQTNSETSLAPSFTLKDYAGKLVASDQFKGKPLVINSWASWCPFCRQELPDFVAAQKEFGYKVVIIAIDRAESLDIAKGYTDKQGTTANLIFLLDPDDSFYKSIGGFSMPETIFVNSDGSILIHKRGPMDIYEIKSKIKQIISS